MDDEIDIKIDVTTMQFLLVQNRQQTHDLTLIGSGANGLGIQEWCYTKLDDEKNAEKSLQVDYSIWNWSEIIVQ